MLSASTTINEELAECLRGAASAADVPCVFKTNSSAAMALAMSGGGKTDKTLLNQAVAALNAGNLRHAAYLAAQALQQDPANPTASYVVRVVEREERLRQANYGKN